MVQESNSISVDNNSRRVSLALGAGGARGIAHMGVLQAVQESGFHIDHISGVSIGAIAGAMFATGDPIETVQSKTIEFIDSPAFQRRRGQMFGLTPAQGYNGNGWLRRIRRVLAAPKSMTRALRSNAILPTNVLKDVVDSLLPDVRIESLPISLSIVAVDVLTGEQVVIEHGSLRDAVRASASIPGVFPPVEIDGKQLCDIGVFDTVPVLNAKRRARDLTVAVDVSDSIVPIEGCKSILDIMTRMQNLAENQLRVHSLAHADIVVRPEIGRRAWFDFQGVEQLVDLGRDAGREALGSYVATPVVSPVSIPMGGRPSQLA